VRNALLNSLVLMPAPVAAQIPVLPANGTPAGIIQVEVSAEALAPGTYVGTVTVTMEGAPNRPARTPVQVTVQR
jgi:hypothetical protein